MLMASSTRAWAVTRCVYFDDLADGQHVADGSILMKFGLSGGGKGLVAERMAQYGDPVMGLLTDPSAKASWNFAGSYRVTLDYITHSPTPGTFVVRAADGAVLQQGKLRAVNHFARLTDSWIAHGAASIEITGHYVLITSICVGS
jgi:hypothetical protein